VAFKSRRQARFEALKTSGLLPFEAMELSRLTWTEIRGTPYIKNFLTMRKSWEAQISSHAEYVRLVKDHYNRQGWNTIREHHTPGNIWEWIRVLEVRWDKDHPDYQTPTGIAGKKKRKKYVNWRR